MTDREGRLSRKLAVLIYHECLKAYGAKITKEYEEQYADIIEGTLEGKNFKFRIHHKKDGKFSKVDWQKVKREDFQEIKAHFDEMVDKIIVLSGEVDRHDAITSLEQEVEKMKVEDK